MCKKCTEQTLTVLIYYNNAQVRNNMPIKYKEQEKLPTQSNIQFHIQHYRVNVCSVKTGTSNFSLLEGIKSVNGMRDPASKIIEFGE